MEQTNNAPARPSFLTVLCILSFIGSGLSTLAGLIGIFASGWIMSMLGMGASQAMSRSEAMGELSADQAAAAEAMADGAAGAVGGIMIVAFVIVFLLSALSLFGVIKMWGLKKSGFWMYAIANGILLILMLIGMNWLGVLFTAAFIGMYAANLKAMK